MTQYRDEIGYILVQICRAHRNLVAADLNELGVHVGQDAILALLWDNEGQPQTQLAAYLGVEPPTINRMVMRMERNGLVERRPDPDDARISRVYLTDKSRAMHAHVIEVWNSIEGQMLVDITDAERALLRRLLLQIQKNLSS